MDRTSKLIAELPYFRIELKPIKFGKSGADYTMDKDTYSIYKGIASVKYCNVQMADELLELSKNHYKTFIDLLKDIKEKTSLNSRQLDILIRLNFFDVFGNNKTLLEMVDIYDKFANAKVIAKKKIEELGVSEYIMHKYSEKETPSQYRGIDNIGLINEMCNKLNNESLNIIDQMRSELDYLGCVNYVNNNMADYYYAIVSFETFKDACKPVVVLRRICDGEEIKAKVKQSKVFKENSFGLLSILKIDMLTYEFKKKMVNNEWVTGDETECVLREYEVVKNI